MRKSKNKMFKNKKLLIVVFFVVVVILIGLGVWIAVEFMGNNNANPAAPSGYTAVYMVSGDVYFGKLHSFPRPYLSDVLYITRNTGQNGQVQLGLVAFKSVSWAPVGDVYFNPNQVLFTAPLRNDSQIVAAIQNPALLTGGAQSQSVGTQAVVPTQVGAGSSTTPSTGK